MEAVIKSAKFIKEFESKFGTLFQHKIEFDDKIAWYSSKTKEQTVFVAGQKAEFTLEEMTGKNGMYFVIKPPKKQNFSNFGKNLRKEQTKYSGFAVSYAKDLCIAGKIDFKELSEYATVLFNLMVELDKSIEQ